IVTTDLATLRAAIELPVDIRAPKGAVALTVVWRPDAGAPRERKFMLVEGDGPDDRAGLPPPAAGSRQTTFRLSEADVAALEAFRREMIEERARGNRGRGSLGVGANRLCRTGEPHDRPIPAAALLKTSETGGYVTALRVADMRKAIADAGAAMPGPLPPCGQT
ncbi:MAG: hypothetical protein ACRCTI_12185, partial [Beijerinckiaceae bacterium]